jgi:hypothetical protein
MISVEIEGDAAVVAHLNEIPPRLKASLAKTIAFLGAELQQIVRGNLSGRVLKARSGKLLGSVALAVSETGTGATATVSAGGAAAPYARFHEYGVGHPWLIQAHGRALRFMVGDQLVFARSVRHPGLPERSFLRSALREMEPQIRTQIEIAVAEALR